MSDNDQAKQEKKEAMKRLREERKSFVQKAAARVKDQKKELKAIKEQLGNEGATAPQIADALGIDVTKVIWYLATMKQYGEVVEGTKDGCYFKYVPVAKEAEEATA